MNTMSIGDQDYLVDKPIDFMVNGKQKTGILKYNKSTFFTTEGFVIKSDVTYDLNKLPPGFQLLKSRDTTDRMKAIENIKLERTRQEQERAQEQEAEIKRRHLEYAAEQERKIQKAILDNERNAKKAAEINERYNIEMQQKKEKDDAIDRLLNAQLETGILSTDTKVGDVVKHNGTIAEVVGKYFEIRYTDENGTVIQKVVKDETLMNITAAINKKQKVDLDRNPPQNQSRGPNAWREGGTRKRRKNRKTRYGLETRS